MEKKSIKPKYSKEEFARRGDEIYDTIILPQLKDDDEGKYIVIDIETKEFEMDFNEIVASDRLFSRNPEAQVWLTRAGINYARNFGPRIRRQSA